MISRGLIRIITAVCVSLCVPVAAVRGTTGEKEPTRVATKRNRIETTVNQISIALARAGQTNEAQAEHAQEQAPNQQHLNRQIVVQQATEK